MSMIDGHLFPRHHEAMPKPLPLLDVTATTAACCAPLAASPLTEAGIVTGDRRGTWTYYRVVPEALTAIARVIDPARS